MEKVSIIIPAFNERKTISKVIREVLRQKISGVKKEVIVVDDGSSDGTGDAVLQYARKKNGVVLIRHPVNKGKGSALRTGILRSSGSIILIQDADLEYHPKEYSKLLYPLLKRKAMVVFGSRIKALHRKYNKMIWSHYIGNRALSFVTSVLYGQRITDMETGYKAFRREVVEGMVLRSKRFDIEPELTAKIRRRGYRITEVPIDFSGRSFKEGKKITWKDGVIALVALVRYRFSW